MPSLYRSKIRLFVFLGLAVICLQLTVLLMLSPWVDRTDGKRQPALDQTRLGASQPPGEPEVKDTRGAWKTLRETPLNGLAIKEQCRGEYRIETGWDGDYPSCLDELRLTATRKGEDQEREIIVLKAMSKGYGLSLVDVKQLGEVTEENTRLLLQLAGVQDCDDDFMGCGYNYTVRVADIGATNAVKHFVNSGVLSSDPRQWNADYTKGYGFIGICEGGCIPEAIYTWSVEDGQLRQFTQEEAYINRDHYDGRVSDAASDPFIHWGTIRWVDVTHLEAERIDEKGDVRILRKEVE